MNGTIVFCYGQSSNRRKSLGLELFCRLCPSVQGHMGQRCINLVKHMELTIILIKPSKNSHTKHLLFSTPIQNCLNMGSIPTSRPRDLFFQPSNKRMSIRVPNRPGNAPLTRQMTYTPDQSPQILHPLLEVSLQSIASPLS